MLMMVTRKNLKDVLSGIFGIKDIGEIPQLKREIEELKLKKELELRDIEHLVKIKEEKLNIEHQKRTIEMEAEFQKKEIQLQTDYHDKVIKQIGETRTEMQSVYTEIMKRLPNITANLEVK